MNKRFAIAYPGGGGAVTLLIIPSFGTPVFLSEDDALKYLKLRTIYTDSFSIVVPVLVGDDVAKRQTMDMS